VKLILRTAQLVSNSSATGSGSDAVTRLTTPAGMPASSNTRNVSTAQSGVCSAGFTTIVHPAASAGATFRVIIDTG
jgi:hypothetical protein